MGTRRGRLIFLALGGVLIAGCGSTVPVSSVSGAAAAPGNGLSPTGPVGGSNSGIPTVPGAVGGTVPVGPGGGATRGGTAAGAAAQTGDGTSVSAPVSQSRQISGWGFDRGHVYIGVGTSDDASSYASSAGLNVNVGNGKAQAQALIDDINKHGGLVGRQIVPVWHDTNAANYNADPSGSAQSECADWTQDHHVFAAANILAYPENGMACLAKAHTIGLTSGAAGPVVSAMLKRYSPYIYAPGMAETGHLTSALIDDLVRQNYFTPWDATNGKAGSAPVKIGVLYSGDRPDLLALSKQALARHHLGVSDSFELQSSSDAGQLSGAVLKFKTEGITHVLTYGYLSLVPRIAESQGYRPRYGISSWDGIQVAASSGSAAQFAGALGVGWTPAEDVDAAHDPAPSVARRHCLELMRAAGQDTADRTTQAVMESQCEQFGLLQAALARAAVLSPFGVRAGVEALGEGFPSPLTFGERFASDRHAGVAAFRPVGFESGCSCFAYGGPIRKFE